VLAAAKPQRTPYATVSDKAGTSHRSSSFVSTVESPATQRINDLEALFREHYDRVFRTAHRVTGSPEDAEDVLQTVFTRLAGAQGATFERSENPEAYLSRAAINASLDLLRKRKRSRSVAIDDFENSAEMSRSAQHYQSRRTPEAHHEDRELRKLIREAVARLGERAGAMFALRYFEGFDNGEIARMMETSTLVVGVTLHRARVRLRKEIGNYLKAVN